MDTIFKIKTTSDAPPPLKKLLKQWIATVQRYSNMHNYNDHCWWYNERATLSSLAGAAWSMEGWVALEEYATHKRQMTKTDGVESEDHHAGRCDLYITNCKVDFAFEGKQAWQRIGIHANPTRYVHKGMLAAWKDTERLADELAYRYAATFVIPSLSLRYIQKKSMKIDHKKVVKMLNTWLDEQKDFIRPNGIPTSYAFVFPRVGHAGFASGSRYYPGVVLILEEVYKQDHTT
ncbi:hypothetical protein [Pseudomonas sp. F3-2]|uniref:hypothetical protein n=1 Tax=Pseudomonas sp. F3-2 TaxID=3141539 RepID=UPI00315D2A57